MEGKKIILVGTDMAYTGYRTHGEGMEGKIVEDRNLRKAECVDGGMVVTGKNLTIYRRWIEQRIKEENLMSVYNTAHGARIKGTLEMTFSEALNSGC